jgi:transcriptional regulator with XRE-family HTH domain
MAAGLTQEQLATFLDVTPQTVSNYERGTSTPWGKSAVAYVEFLEQAVTAARAARADVMREFQEIRREYQIPDSIEEALKLRAARGSKP